MDTRDLALEAAFTSTSLRERWREPDVVAALLLTSLPASAQRGQSHTQFPLSEGRTQLPASSVRWSHPEDPTVKLPSSSQRTHRGRGGVSVQTGGRPAGPHRASEPPGA